MNKIQENINGNAGKYVLGTTGLIAAPKVMQHIFKEGGFKGTLSQNIDAFVNTKCGVADVATGIIEETVTGKTSIATKLIKNKYAKIAMLAILPIITTAFGLSMGHAIDKSIAKAHNKEE